MSIKELLLSLVRDEGSVASFSDAQLKRSIELATDELVRRRWSVEVDRHGISVTRRDKL